MTERKTGEACDTGDLGLAGKIRDSSVRAGAEGMDGNILEADFLARLNEGQRRAAEHPARAVAVIAGPGTGKTGTGGFRIAALQSSAA